MLPKDIVDKVYFEAHKTSMSKVLKQVIQTVDKINWFANMKLVNNVFTHVCDIDGYTEGADEGQTFREIFDDIGVNGLTFKSMEYIYYNLADEYGHTAYDMHRETAAGGV